MRKPLRQEHWRSEGREAMIIEMMRRRALLIVNPRSGRGASDLSAGLDWQTRLGLYLGAGWNQSLKGGVGGMPYFSPPSDVASTAAVTRFSSSSLPEP